MTEFFDYMEKTLDKVLNENKDIYICGDFNLDLLKINSCEFNKRFFELMYSYGLLHQITIPTRTTASSAPSSVSRLAP